MKLKTLRSISVLFACLPLTAGGDVITPLLSTDGGSSTSSFLTSEDAVRTIDRTVDGSGLSATPTAANILTVEHTAATAPDNHYLGNTLLTGGGATIADEVLTFDLGGLFDVTDIYLWTYERSQAGRGLVRFDLSFSTDGGVTFTTPVAASTLGITDFQLWGAWTVRTPQQRTFTASQTGVTTIRFSNIVNGGDGTRLGISEIRFGGVPGSTAAGPVDEGTSTVDASPDAALADGASTSTITVTLRDSVGTPVGSEEVSLTAALGTPIIGPSATQTTNAAGVAIFTVSSSTVGTEVFTATSSTNGTVVTDTASVDFQSTAVDAANSTVSAPPTDIPANDITTTTITVTVRNSGELPLPGKLVLLAGNGDNNVAPAGVGSDTTDANGVATFTVKSGTAGLETFTATSESVTITDTASVDFFEIPTGDVITPTGATSTSSVGSPRTIDKAIDGSGLTDVSDPSSVWDDSHGYNTNWYWLSASSAVAAGDEVLTFDLGGSFDVDSVFYWTYERVGDRNLRTFDISFSTDGGSTFSDPVSAASLNMADWAIGGSARDPSFARTATFDTLSGITHIRFSNLQNHGDPSYFALNEIRFAGPLPPALITDFEAAGAKGVINQSVKTISVEVPFGTDLSTLAPTFTLSSGTSDQPSGAVPTPDFGASNPITYTVTDTSTDPPTGNTYSVTVTVAPAIASLVIDLGTGTTIEGGAFIGSGPTNLPLPELPAGSILRSITFDDVTLTATDNGSDGNYTSDLTVLLDPTPATEGGDFSLGITSTGANQNFGAGETLVWNSDEGGLGTVLTETKTDADWTGDIDLATTGLFLGNAFRGADWVSPEGGTWTGTITLTYDIVGSGTTFAGWSGGAPADSDANGDGVENAVAYALGAADVNEIAIGLLPTFDNSSDATYFVFTYNRDDEAEADATTAITAEWATDLSGWNTAVNDSPSPGDVVITETGSDPTNVEVKIARSLAVDGKLFARLKVVVNP